MNPMHKIAVAGSLAVTLAMLAPSLSVADQGGSAQARPHRQTQNRAARDPGVNTRQHRQQERIQQGVRSGELTREEAQALRQDQREIRKQEREYKSDGKLTREERRNLHKELNESSQDIRAEKHDADKRP